LYCLYHFIKIIFVQKSSYKVQSRKPNVEFYFRNFFFIYYYYFIFFGTRYKSVIIGEGDNNMYAIFVCIWWHYNKVTYIALPKNITVIYEELVIKCTMAWLIHWCLTPTLAVFQLCRGIMDLRVKYVRLILDVLFLFL